MMCENENSDCILIDGDISKTLVKYATDVNADIRQEFGVTLSNLLKQQPLEDILKHIHDFASTLLMVADDKSPEVRLRLVDQIPFIFRQCHEHASPDLEHYLYDRLLQVVLQYLQDEENEVRKEAYSALRMLLGRNILGKKRIEETICPAVLSLSQNVDCENLFEFNVTTGIMLIGRLAPIIGPEKSEEYFLDHFIELCSSKSNGVRRICATIYPIICHVMGTKVTEEKLLGPFLTLCDDVFWNVRKACAESITLISLVCTPKCRRETLTSYVLALTKDSSKWVAASTLKILGQFIATFADPCITGLVYSYNGDLHVTNPMDSNFKDHPDPEIVANCEHYLNMFSKQIEISSITGNITDNISRNNNNNNNNNNSNISVDNIRTTTTTNANETAKNEDYVDDDDKLTCEQIAQIINFNKVKLIKQINDDGYIKKGGMLLQWNDDSMNDYSWTLKNGAHDHLFLKNGAHEIDFVAVNDDNDVAGAIKFDRKLFSDPSASTIRDLNNPFCNDQIFSLPSSSTTPMQLHSSQSIESLNEDNTSILDDLKSEGKEELFANIDNFVEKISQFDDPSSMHNGEIQKNSTVENDNNNSNNLLETTPSLTLSTIDPSLNSNKLSDGPQPSSVLHPSDHFFRKNTPSDLSLIIKKAIIFEGQEKKKKQRSQIPIPETPLVFTTDDPLLAKEQDEQKQPEIINSQNFTNSNKRKKNRNLNNNNNNNNNHNKNHSNNNNSNLNNQNNIIDCNSDITVNNNLKYASGTSIMNNVTDIDDDSDDDAFQDFNSHKYWYISPELSSDDINLINEMNSVNSNKILVFNYSERSLRHNYDNKYKNYNNAMSTNNNDDIIESNSVINREMSLVEVFKEMTMNSHTNNLNFNPQTDFNQKIKFNPPNDFNQKIVPIGVLESFVKMVLHVGDEEMNLNCAYNFPAVALTIGKDNWHILKSLLQYLCDDLDWKVRKTIASSIDLLAMILGKEIATDDLLPIYLGFFKDLDEVKIEAIRHFANFLKAIDEKRHEEILSNIGICLRVDSKTNWRIKEDLAKQVVLLIKLYETLNKHESLLYLTSLTGLFLEDKVSCVREIASDAMAAIIRISSVKQQEAIIKLYLVQEFALSDSWRKRQTFVNIFYKLLSSHERTVDLFRTVIAEIKRLSYDAVPNIRLLVAKSLVQLITIDQNIVSSEKPEDFEIVKILRRLQQDDDRDVKEGSYSLVLPPKELIGYENSTVTTSGSNFSPNNDDENDEMERQADIRTMNEYQQLIDDEQNDYHYDEDFLNNPRIVITSNCLESMKSPELVNVPSSSSSSSSSSPSSSSTMVGNSNYSDDENESKYLEGFKSTSSTTTNKNY